MLGRVGEVEGGTGEVVGRGGEVEVDVGLLDLWTPGVVEEREEVVGLDLLLFVLMMLIVFILLMVL